MRLSFLSSLLFAVLWGCLTAGTALADNFDQHYQRGMKLYQQKNYEESADELLKAYELKQLPRVLLNLGTVYRKMGKARDAMLFYERYLKAEPNPPAKIKKEVDTFINETRALVEAPEVQAEIERTKEPAPAGWDRESGEMQPWLAAQIKQEQANKPLYKRAWFWGLIGGIVAVGIITGVTAGVVSQQRAIPSGIDIIQF